MGVLLKHLAKNCNTFRNLLGKILTAFGLSLIVMENSTIPQATIL